MKPLQADAGFLFDVDSDRVAMADPEGQELRTRKLGQVRAKGFTEPIAAFELYPAHTPSVSDWLAHDWAAAVDLFTDGKWADAYDILMRQFPEDLAAQCLLRVMDQAKKRLPANWDGSFVPPTTGE